MHATKLLRTVNFQDEKCSGTLPDGPLRRFAKCHSILLDEVVKVCVVQCFHCYQLSDILRKDTILFRLEKIPQTVIWKQQRLRTYRMPACHHVQNSYMQINMKVTK